MKKQIVLAAFLLVGIITWNCVDFDIDAGRFWLLDPSATGQKNLLPYAYNSYGYYAAADEYGWRDGSGGAKDDTYKTQNALAWKEMVQNQANEQDIYKILYETDAAAYLKIQSGANSFAKALKQPQFKQLADYLWLAKWFEAEADQKGYARAPYKNPVEMAKALIKEQGNNPELQRRTAYQLMRNTPHTDPLGAQLYQTYFQDKPKKDWLYAAATYLFAQKQKNKTDRHLWLSRALEAGFYEPIWITNELPDTLDQAIAAAKLPRDKANLMLISTLQNPAPVYAKLEKAFQTDPSSPLLAQALAREVNKLENWLLSPRILPGADYIFGLTLSPSRSEEKKLLQKDLDYLASVRGLTNKIIASGQQGNPAFWQLTAAHLAYLGQDFDQVQNHVKQGLNSQNLSQSHRTELRLIDFLAQFEKDKGISAALEDQIPDLYQEIRKAAPYLAEPNGLQKQLSALLSRLYDEKGDVAKAAIFFGKTTGVDTCYQARPGYEYMLRSKHPEAFDRMIEIVSAPKTKLEQWIAREPQAYSSEYYYGDEKKPSISWDINRLKELKSIYYMRRGQHASALDALHTIPNTYWKEYYGKRDYLKNNPFSIGIEIDQIELSKPSENKFDKYSFLKKFMELKNAPLTQENAFLIANAYLNMSYHGKDWWLMQHVERSNVELEYPEEFNYGSAQPEPQADWMYPALVLVGLMGISVRKLKSRRVPLLMVALLAFGIYACKEKQQPQKVIETAPAISFDIAQKAYYSASMAKEWYEKAYQMDQNNDIGVASLHMLAQCDRYAQMVEKAGDLIDFVPAKNQYDAQLVGKTFKSKMTCSDFSDALQGK